ncbi:MAG: MarR family transcriptional regulator [Mariniblastus sp.]|nr:MarR family transcriptional regulator [Mariniblastus sp.]
MSHHLTEGDLQLIESLRLAPQTISELGDELGVSANAVRQRLGRLSASGLISRKKSGEGRGRPHHEYHLTTLGHRTAGNNFPDLAKALLEVVQSIEDPKVRKTLLSNAIQRLLDSYESEVVGETIEARLAAIQKFYDDRDIPIAVERSAEGALPVLKVLECPYPDLEDKDHQFCEIEKQLFAKVVGTPVHLCQCRKDGDTCCSFQSMEKNLKTMQ